MAYKITDEELEAIVQDWPADWCKPVSMEEIYVGTPVHSLDELFQPGKDLHDSDGESSTNSYP